MPQSMVDALKAQAKQEGMPYQRLIRSILETAIARRKQRA
jgi:predicted DNA binding CopG/RHH family protein